MGDKMQIQIGSDECILWLRKNNKVPNVPNNLLGRRIGTLIQKSTIAIHIDHSKIIQ
jgi:hypothetical protein